MDTRPQRVLPATNAAAFVTVCTAFAPQYHGAGLYPDSMESWLDDHQWLAWTAAGAVVPRTLAIPVRSPRTPR
ncbi:hypothetical protein [Streptomyces wuyuanensis]|uniref:Uncharacterized protein n=1 Tax=Streptomyces wuyuanensis TaxID=1196353 RepID=A0A1H0B1W1_9ACTN|nr:hypothetical protein [Streptomyces wuyuanensis]SDN39661.1 hypothetical protein SAMN05444921_1265 [Streptomyces wuyuanensis]